MLPCTRSRPVLGFLEARNFRPLLIRTLKTSRGPPRRLPSTRSQAVRRKDETDQSFTNTGRQDASQSPSPPSSSAPPAQSTLSSLLSKTDASSNSLLAPVHIPEDPRAVLKSNHPSTYLLEQSGIVVQRQIEMMNLFLGFEQANRYVILSPEGEHIGYMAEHDGGIAKSMGRQFFRTHRAFVVHVFDRSGKEVLRFQRPFSWINTRIRVFDPVELASGLSESNRTDLVQGSAGVDPLGNQQISSLRPEEMRVIGEAHSEWAPLRRKYNLFLAHELHKAQELSREAIPSDLSNVQRSQVKAEDHFSQFAYVDEPFLSWDFSLKDSDGKLIGSVNRNWRGFGRELFTDTGAYALRMDSAGLDQEAEQRHIVSQSHKSDKAYAETLGGNDDKYGMTLDQRAIMLATAVTVDFDYFSRHSSSAGGIFPMPFMMGGGGAAEGAAGGAAGAGEGAVLGETVSGAGGMIGRGATGVGAGEGAIAGAGTMAGYEAMQRGMEGSGSGNSAQGSEPSSEPSSFPPEQEGQDGDLWGTSSDPWTENAAGSSGEGGGEGGILSMIWDAIFGGGN